MINNGKKIILSISLVLSLALVLAVAFWISDLVYAPHGETGEEESVDLSEILNAIYIDDELYLPKMGVRNYLIIGVDKYGDAANDLASQADFLMIMSFDSNAETYTMVSINRDTMALVDEVDGFGGHRMVYKQIALSHVCKGTEGVTNRDKCINTAKAASRLLYGMEFDGYLSMTMDAVSILVDRVGGVDVLVEDDLTAVDARLVKGETVTMDGELAMKFVRARGGLEDSSNTGRMKRQEAFLKEFFKKFGATGFGDEQLISMYEEIAPHTYNSSGEDGYEELFYKLSNYTLLKSLSLEGESKVGLGGYIEFYIDEEHLKEVMVDVFYEKAYK